MMIRRRAFIAQTGAAVLLAGRASAQAPVIARRPATLEWAAAETIVAIGGTPVATASPYRMQGDLTASFAGVAEIGSMFAPNFEDIQLLKPDLIFCAAWQRQYASLLRRIAPVHVFDLQHPPELALGNTFRLMADAGRLIGREAEAAAFQASAETTFDALKMHLQTVSERPVLIGTLQPDGRYMTVFGKGSLFEAVLRRVGLGNAWVGSMSAWGTRVVGVETLADYPETPLLYFGTGSQAMAARQLLSSNAIWNALPSVRRGDVKTIPYAWPFGGLPTALRFGRSLVAALAPGTRDGHG